jgi:transketolase
MIGDMVAPRAAFGRALVELAKSMPELVVLDPDVCSSTQTSLFRSAWPERFFAMGIAEANTVCAAAGMAACGRLPWVSAFAAFLATRALDQVRVSVAHTGLPVKLNGSYGGLPSGRGGATHSACEDIAAMRALPGMTVLTPADAVETAAMTGLATRLPGPVYLRTVRCEVPTIFEEAFRPEIGRATILADGGDVAIVSEGMMSARALAAARLLAAEGIYARVLHFGTIKPLDREALAAASRHCGRVVTVENHSVTGGLGSAVCEALAEEAPCPVARLGFPDVFLESGDDELIFSRYGLDAAGIAAAVRRLMERNDQV